jgi:TRAP-type C4-dicarboxylate transport system permease small subunit
MTRVIDGFFSLLRMFIVACLAGMVILVFGNVVLRYGFNSGITFSEEFSRWLFVWLTFVGAALAMRNHAHLGMDSVVSRLPPAGKKACFVVSNLLMLGCVVIFWSGAWQQTVINLENRAPATDLSYGLFYGIGLFFCVVTAALLLRNLYVVLTGRAKESDLVQVRESEDKAAIHHLEEIDPPAGTGSTTKA